MAYIVELIGLVLIILKINNSISLDWNIVLIPTILSACGRVCVFVATRDLKKIKEKDF
jgi:hypothetical protein